MSPTGQDLLRAYDEQLRTDAETPSAIRVERLGPLRLVTFAGGEGFVTYRDLGGADQPTIRSWVEQALARYRRDGAWRVEWKTRGHDRAPGLNEALLEHGFVAAEQEAIMIGPARALAIEVPLPADVVVERASTSAQIRAALIAQDEIFGEPLPTGNIFVSYRFQFTEPSDTFAIDYDTRQVLDINLTIRNFPQSNLPNGQSITVQGSASVRNFIR